MSWTCARYKLGMGCAVHALVMGWPGHKLDLACALLVMGWAWAGLISPGHRLGWTCAVHVSPRHGLGLASACLGMAGLEIAWARHGLVCATLVVGWA